MTVSPYPGGDWLAAAAACRSRRAGILLVEHARTKGVRDILQTSSSRDGSPLWQQVARLVLGVGRGSRWRKRAPASGQPSGRPIRAIGEVRKRSCGLCPCCGYWGSGAVRGRPPTLTRGPSTAPVTASASGCPRHLRTIRGRLAAQLRLRPQGSRAGGLSGFRLRRGTSTGGQSSALRVPVAFLPLVTAAVLIGAGPLEPPVIFAAVKLRLALLVRPLDRPSGPRGRAQRGRALLPVADGRTGEARVGSNPAGRSRSRASRS